MNREEALKKLQELYDWHTADDIDFDDKLDEKYLKNLLEIMNYLRQPITIADFLGWEEDVEYRDSFSEDKFRIKKGELQYFSKYGLYWKESNLNKIVRFKNWRPVVITKYRLVLKEEYRQFLGKTKDVSYFSADVDKKEVMLSNIDTTDMLLQEFTDEDIKMIEGHLLPNNFNFDMFDKERVD